MLIPKLETYFNSEQIQEGAGKNILEPGQWKTDDSW